MIFDYLDDISEYFSFGSVYHRGFSINELMLNAGNIIIDKIKKDYLSYFSEGFSEYNKINKEEEEYLKDVNREEEKKLKLQAFYFLYLNVYMQIQIVILLNYMVIISFLHKYMNFYLSLFQEITTSEI